ncbi:MAG: hypothetical protein AAGD06_32435, partial [Acidobacteriota bacterium]
PYIVLGVVGTLLFGPELTSFLSRVGRWLVRGLVAGLDLLEGQAVRWSLSDQGPIRRFVAFLLHLAVGALKWVMVFLARLVTQPVRSYFYPTLGDLLLVCILHWFIFGTAIWMVEADASKRKAFDSIAVFGQEFLTALWHFAVYLVSAGMDGGIPETVPGRFLALTALVLFIVILAAYSSAIHETRERLNLRRLRSKPRYLPMFGHFLVTGDIPAIRMLLHQFESYGVCQDVVVATRTASTSAVVGLGRLEPVVWAIEGDLWEGDVRHRAYVRHASALVVAGASLGPNDTVRTVLAVEGENSLVQSAVDARRQDLRILRQALRSKDGRKRTGPREHEDLLLSWRSRRSKMQEDLIRIPQLQQFLLDLIRYRPHPGEAAFGLMAHGHRYLLFRFLFGWYFRRRVDRDEGERRFLVAYARCFDVVPLLRIEAAVPWEHRLLCVSTLEGATGLHRLARRALTWLRRRRGAAGPKPPPTNFPRRSRTAEVLSEHLSSALGEGQTGHLRSAGEGALVWATSAGLPQDPPSDFDGETPGAEDRQRGIPNQPAREAGSPLATADGELLHHLCQQKVWKVDGARVLVTFHHPDSADALDALCTRYRQVRPTDPFGPPLEPNAAKGAAPEPKPEPRIEAYSDLEMRTLWLSLCALLGRPTLELLMGLWPVPGDAPGDAPGDTLGNEEPPPGLYLGWSSLRLPDVSEPGGVGFESLTERLLGTYGVALLAVRPATPDPGGGERRWYPLARGRRLYTGDQILFLAVEASSPKTPEHPP